MAGADHDFAAEDEIEGIHLHAAHAKDRVVNFLTVLLHHLEHRVVFLFITYGAGGFVRLKRLLADLRQLIFLYDFGFDSDLLWVDDFRFAFRLLWDHGLLAHWEKRCTDLVNRVIPVGHLRSVLLCFLCLFERQRGVLIRVMVERDFI